MRDRPCSSQTATFLEYLFAYRSILGRLRPLAYSPAEVLPIPDGVNQPFIL